MAVLHEETAITATRSIARGANFFILLVWVVVWRAAHRNNMERRHAEGQAASCS